MVYSTLRHFVKVPVGGFILQTIKPIEAVEFYDIIDPENKTAKSFSRFKDTETGWERIKKVFEVE